MKQISKKICIYLLLIEPFFAIFTSVIVTVSAYGTDPSFLKNSVIYQMINAVLVTFIYINVAKINKELKITSILTYFCLTIAVVSALVWNYFPQIILYNPYIVDILDFIASVLSIPLAYYFCKGFYVLVSENTKNVSLAEKWMKLLKSNIDLAVINLIFLIVNYFIGAYQLTENMAVTSIVLLVSFGVVVFGLYLTVLKIIYLLKTAKELS